MMPTPRSKPLSEDGGVLGAAARFWQRSYVADYLGFAVLLAAYLLIWLVLEPFHRMFSLDNLSLQYPHAEIERVSVFWNIIYAVLLPLGFIVFWAIILQPGTHRVHVTILGLAISIILTTFITDIIKNAAGRPRPDLIARCKPKPGTPKHELVTIDVCTELDHHILHDGWRSFPSGHSSLAFSGLGFLALFLAGQTHVFRPRTDLSRVLLALAPLVGAALIAISRLEDYRHDVYDVCAGSLLGILIANFSYRRYFPSLKASRCDEPYPSRSDVAMNGSGRRRDEESRGQHARDFDGDVVEDELEERQPLNNANNRDRERLGDGA